MNIRNVNATMDAGLEELARAKEKVNHCLVAYESECQRLIDEIGAGSRSDAEQRFDTLFDVAGRLSKAWFLLDIEIGDPLKAVVRAFERLHESHSRDYWYKRFQAGERWPD